jgi:hypothetical protein
MNMSRKLYTVPAIVRADGYFGEGRIRDTDEPLVEV